VRLRNAAACDDEFQKALDGVPGEQRGEYRAFVVTDVLPSEILTTHPRSLWNPRTPIDPAVPGDESNLVLMRRVNICGC